MSSDSSSEDEEMQKLREATDTQFINDSMFKEKQSVKDPKDFPSTKAPSLRRTKDEDEQFNLFRVSPAFRTFVAKHLSSLLDEILKKKISKKCDDSFKKAKSRKNGIKLFHDSLHYIKLKDKSNIGVIKKRRVSDSDEKTSEQFELVAVSAEDILSKKDIKHWSKRSKAPVYNYVQTDNGLVLQ